MAGGPVIEEKGKSEKGIGKREGRGMLEFTKKEMI